MRNILITGSGIGIGAATALAFGKAGDRVIVTDILKEEGLKVVSEINNSKGNAEFYYLDVRSTEEANKTIAAVEDKYGSLDVLICNAGIAHKVPLDELTDEKWDYTFDVDLKGMFRVIRAAANSMKMASKGSIVCLSSIMGVAYGWDKHVHYSAAKAGVVGLVRGLAVELGEYNINVNGVAPGYIRTAQSLSEEHSLGLSALKKTSDFIPIGRFGEPEDVSEVITFLASDAARYISGQVITVDGGLLVGRY